MTLCHRVWQQHHVPPCVLLGIAAPNDKWCSGCRSFIAVSEQVQAKLERQAMDRAERAARR